MYWFVVPLLIGFGLNAASASTAALLRRWGARAGRTLTVILRDILGIPLWVLGLVLAVSARSAPLFVRSTGTTAIGLTFSGMGALMVLLALWRLGKRAFAPSVSDGLLEEGLDRRIRHPIHTGALLQFAGLPLLVPTLRVLLACACGAGWVLIQTRLEEIDLLQRIPEYEGYARRVRRFVPRIRSTRRA
jgi:protein-S-isoprenylcysteine O-methyltransferase Ste14